MKLGILADIHGHLENLRKAIIRLNREQVDQFIVLGDVIRYLRQSYSLAPQAAAAHRNTVSDKKPAALRRTVGIPQWAALFVRCGLSRMENGFWWAGAAASVIHSVRVG